MVERAKKFSTSSLGRVKKFSTSSLHRVKKFSTSSIEFISSPAILYQNEKVYQQQQQKTTSLESEIEKEYIPHEHRILQHPNTFLGAFLHMIKGSLGTGILAVPGAYKNAGLLVGIIGNILVGIICTHTIYILVQASQKASKRAKVPSLGFADTVEQVFLQGPDFLQKWASFAKVFTEIALVLTQYLTNAVYFVFISVTLTKLTSNYYPETDWWDVYVFKLIIMSLLMFLVQVREIKHMVPFSFIANTMLMTTFGITGYYMFSGLGNNSDVNLTNGLSGIPLYLSTLLFAMEGIALIMPVENSMPKPIFLGPCGVLNSSMIIIVFFFLSIGSFGYYRYGEETASTITMNLPDNEITAQIAQAAIAISIFFSFMLQFYVPTEILWNRIKKRLPEETYNLAQILLRVVTLLAVTGISIIGGDNLGPLIGLVGAIFFSFLGLVLPSILDIIVNWEEGWGVCNWKLIKNVTIITIALFALVSGTYYAILDMV